jgi:hypothetical protein
MNEVFYAKYLQTKSPMVGAQTNSNHLKLLGGL